MHVASVAQLRRAGETRPEHLADDRGRPVPHSAGRYARPALALRPGLAVIPEPAALDDDGRAEYEVRLIPRDIDGAGSTSLFYKHHPLDVEGWRGDNFPFTFNIDDYNVITSDSVHLPPTVHLFMQATG